MAHPTGFEPVTSAFGVQGYAMKLDAIGQKILFLIEIYSLLVRYCPIMYYILITYGMDEHDGIGPEQGW